MGLVRCCLIESQGGRNCKVVIVVFRACELIKYLNISGDIPISSKNFKSVIPLREVQFDLQPTRKHTGDIVIYLRVQCMGKPLLLPL